MRMFGDRPINAATAVTVALIACAVAAIFLYALFFFLDFVDQAITVCTAIGGLFALCQLANRTAVGRRMRSHLTRRIDRWLYKQPPMIGREHICGLVSDLLADADGHPSLLVVHGFAGVGKTHLLRHLHYSRLSSSSFITLQTRGMSLPEVLVSAFGTSAPPFQSDAIADFYPRLASSISPGTLLMIDQVPSESADFMAGLRDFMRELRDRKVRIVIVAACRHLPHSLPEGCHLYELRGFSLDETMAFLRHPSTIRASTKPQATLQTHRARLWEATGGNPQLMLYVACTPRNWDRIIRDAAINLQDIPSAKAFLEEAWTDFGKEAPDLQEASMLLATVTQIADVIDDALCAIVFSHNWFPLRERLWRRGVLHIVAPGQCKYHDIFASHVYLCMGRTTAATYHKHIASAIASAGPAGEPWRVIALRHALASQDVKVSEGCYALARRQLLKTIDLDQAGKLIMSFLTTFPESALCASCRLDHAECLSMAGRYEESLSAYSSMSAVSAILRPRKILGTAFAQHCRGDFSRAIAECEAIDDGASDESREARSLLAHCHAHIGAFEESEARFRALLKVRHLDITLHSNALWGLAWVTRALGHYSESELLSDKCLRLSLSINHHRASGLAYWNLATNARVSGHLGHAQRHCTSASTFLESYRVRSRLHLVHEEAEILRAQGKHAAAANLTSTTRDQALRIGDRDCAMHMRLAMQESRRMLDSSVSPNDYSDCEDYFARHDVKWALLSTRVAKFLCMPPSQRDERAPFILPHLISAALSLRWDSELACLRQIANHPTAIHLHPLFYM